MTASTLRFCCRPSFVLLLAIGLSSSITNSGQLELTAVEFKLLQLLVEHSGVFSTVSKLWKIFIMKKALRAIAL
jgi:hypothetical protein